MRIPYTLSLIDSKNIKRIIFFFADVTTYSWVVVFTDISLIMHTYKAKRIIYSYWGYTLLNYEYTLQFILFALKSHKSKGF